MIGKAVQVLGGCPERANAIRESGWKRGSSQSPASIRVRTRIFKQGNCPAFSFVFVMLKKAQLAAAGTRKTLINIAS